MNSCNFVGRLTAEPELRRTDNGNAVCSYSLAVKRPMVADTTDFIEFVSWRQSAEYLCKYGHKGDVVAATGTLQPRTWTDKDGNKRKTMEIVTTSVELLSSKKNAENNNQPTQNQNGFQGQACQPQQNYQQPQNYGGYQQPAPQQSYQQPQPQYNQQGFGSYQQNGYPQQNYQPPFPQQGSYAPIEGDDAQLPF